MIENIDKTCRVCLKFGDISLFDFNYDIQLMKIASVKIFLNDGFPSAICNVCVLSLQSACDFCNQVEETDLKLKSEENSVSTFTVLCCNNNDYQPTTVQTETEFKDNCTDNIINISQKLPHEFIIEEIVLNANDEYNTLIEQKKELKDTINLYKTEYSVIDTQEELCEVAEYSQPIEELQLPSKIKDLVKRKPNKRKKKVSTEISSSNSLSNIKNSPNKNKRNQNRKHMCEKCGKTFLYQSNLHDHKRIHTGDKPFICSICGRGFAQTGHLLVHTRSHNGEKPYKCDICSRSFSIRQALKKHSRIHTGERPYSCTFSLCKKTFVTSYHLSNHFKRHTGEKNFKCDWSDCTLSFVNISEMKRHKMRHEKNQDYVRHKNYNQQNQDS